MRIPLIVCASLLMMVPHLSSAQTLYRCGSTYQDKPCDGPLQGKAVGTAQIAPTAPTPVKADANCAQQGADAIKIMWMKEGGRTEQEQTADTVSMGAPAEFVRYVYGKRGSATEVRASVEADCIAARDRKAQAAKLSAAAHQLAGQDPPSSTPRPAVSAPIQAPLPGNSTAARPKDDARAKDGLCKSLRDQVKATGYAQLTGGSTADMELLSQQMRQVDSQLRSLGCS